MIFTAYVGKLIFKAYVCNKMDVEAYVTVEGWFLRLMLEVWFPRFMLEGCL